MILIRFLIFHPLFYGTLKKICDVYVMNMIGFFTNESINNLNTFKDKYKSLKIESKCTKKIV